MRLLNMALIGITRGKGIRRAMTAQIPNSAPAAGQKEEEEEECFVNIMYYAVLCNFGRF